MTGADEAFDRAFIRLAWRGEIVCFLASIALLLLLIPIRSLAIFYLCSATALLLRRKLCGWPARFFVALVIACLTLLLLYYRSSALLTVVLGKYLHWSAAAPQLPLVDALGVSYCWLRAVYAIAIPTMTLWDFTRYYFFFPTFASGPILKPSEFLWQRPSLNTADFMAGMTRITYGGLKFVLGSFLQLMVPLSTVHHAVKGIQSYPAPVLWLGAVSAGFWLYLNFSAFTDMAIGLSRAIGVRIPENFRHPYRACNLTDFWRCWHITLGDWLRGNIYNPLARQLGRVISLQSISIVVLPAIVAMVVCGLWHQTTRAFLTWGALHGVGLATHQVWQRTGLGNLMIRVVGASGYRVLSWALTHSYVTLGWVFFFPVAAPGFSFHILYLKRLFGLH